MRLDGRDDPSAPQRTARAPRRLPRALVAALGLHASTFALMSRIEGLDPPAGVPEGSSPAFALDLDLSVEEPASPERKDEEPRLPYPGEDRPEPSRRRGSSHLAPPAIEPMAKAAATDAAGRAADAAATDAAGRAADATATLKSIDLGLRPGDGWKLAQGLAIDTSNAPALEARRALEPPSAEPHWLPPRSTTGGLREALEEHDREVGLGKGGPVLSAAQAAARGEWAPAAGTAIFEIFAEATGKVSVRVRRGAAPAGAWDKVGDELAAALRSKPPALPKGVSGMRFEVEVEAKLLHDAPKTEIEATVGEATDKPKEPIRVTKVPGVYLRTGTRACQIQVALTPSVLPLTIAGGCEPPQKQSRTVSTRLLSEARY